MTAKNLSSNSFKKNSLSRRKKNLFGGSIASDLVNQLASNNQCQTLPESVMNVLNKDFIISNYGSSYKTTGGGKSLKKNKPKFNENFISKTLDNIKSYLENKLSMNNMVTNMKSYWNNNVNFKLSTKNAKTIASDLFNSNYSVEAQNKNKVKVTKKGGARTVLPRRWFDPDYQDTYMTSNITSGENQPANCPMGRSLPSNYEASNYYPYYKKSCMTGGRNNLQWDQDNYGKTRTDGDSNKMGANIPEGIPQKIQNQMNGVSTMFSPGRGSINVSEAQYFCNSTNCAPVNNDFRVDNTPVEVTNINTDSQYSFEMPFTSGVVYPSSVANPIGNFGTHGLPIPNQRAGGRKKSVKKQQGVGKTF